MIILAIRTDKPEAEIGLYEDNRELKYEAWEAHRALAEIIHFKIKNLLESQHMDIKDINAVAVFKGPGSFTGLRIGISVANALADSLRIPIYGSSGDDWIRESIAQLKSSEDLKAVMPEYGANPHVTKPRH